MSTPSIHRRRALTGVAGLGLALPVIAACSDDGGAQGTDPGGAATGGSGNRGSGGPLASTSDVPVGGGIIVEGEKVVVTQPTEGDFKAFSSICTHQGCPVGKVEDGVIVCPCHGSQFSIEDGSVTLGPATAPLEEVRVDVQGGEISLA